MITKYELKYILQFYHNELRRAASLQIFFCHECRMSSHVYKMKTIENNKNVLIALTAYVRYKVICESN